MTRYRAPLPPAFELLNDIHVSILYKDIHTFKNSQNRQNRQNRQASKRQSGARACQERSWQFKTNKHRLSNLPIVPISQKGQNLISASNIGSAPLPLAFELLSDIHVSILYEDIHDFKNRQNRQNRQRLQKDSPGPEHVKNDLGNSKQINIDCLICLSCLYFFLFFFRFSTPSSR